MAYQYKMVQVPPTISISSKEDEEGIAAAYLEEIVNQKAQEGWEFYRVDSIGIETRPGCLASLFGKSAETIVYYVITFRKEK